MKIKNLKAMPDEIYEYYNYPIEGKCSDAVIIDSKQAEAYYQAADIVISLLLKLLKMLSIIRNMQGLEFQTL